jgi:hypothetical protein
MTKDEGMFPINKIDSDLEYITTQLILASKINMQARLVYNALLLALHSNHETPIDAFADAVNDILS